MRRAEVSGLLRATYRRFGGNELPGVTEASWCFLTRWRSWRSGAGMALLCVLAVAEGALRPAGRVRSACATVAAGEPGQGGRSLRGGTHTDIVATHIGKQKTAVGHGESMG